MGSVGAHHLFDALVHARTVRLNQGKNRAAVLGDVQWLGTMVMCS